MIRRYLLPVAIALLIFATVPLALAVSGSDAPLRQPLPSPARPTQ